MKKFLLIITVVLMVLSGCEKAPSEIIKEPSSSESSVSEESRTSERRATGTLSPAAKSIASRADEISIITQQSFQ